MAKVIMTQADVAKPVVLTAVECDSTEADKRWDADAAAKVPADVQLDNWRRTMLSQAMSALGVQLAKATPQPTPAQVAAQAKAQAAAQAAAVLVDSVL